MTNLDAILKVNHLKAGELLTKSGLFKLAHQMTKFVNKKGDNYAVTFGASLKMLKAIINNLYVVELAKQGRFKEVVAVINDKPLLSTLNVAALRDVLKAQEKRLLDVWCNSKARDDWQIYRSVRMAEWALKQKYGKGA